MAAIMTGNHGSLAFWDASPTWGQGRPFGSWTAIETQKRIGFARLSAFSANGNHAPSERDAVSSADAALDLLYRIAGAR